MTLNSVLVLVGILWCSFQGSDIDLPFSALFNGMTLRNYFSFQTKCEKYWPEAGETTLYGELQVTTGSDLENPFWTLREFNIKHV